MKMKIKKGDLVARKSYGKDIIFVVDEIIKSDVKKDIAILKGLTIRIKADADIDDLEVVEKKIAENTIKRMDDRIKEKANEYKKVSEGTTKSQRELNNKGLNKSYIYTGKILHLDGDRRYSEKSAKYYKSLGLNAVVKNIPENKQALQVRSLLERYKPDILVITRA